MEQLNTVIDQWHERIGALQQRAVESRAAYLATSQKLDSLKTPVPNDKGTAARAGGYLRKAFGYAFRAPMLLYKQDSAKLDMQREQFKLDSFITETTSQLATALAPALGKAAPDTAHKIDTLQSALDAGLKARKDSDYAVISCAQAANNIQWANNKYYFNALQRCQNSARHLRDASDAIEKFNTTLGQAGTPARFDDIGNIQFEKFGPEFSGSNNVKFTDARKRLEAQRGEMSVCIDDLRTHLLDTLSQAADTLAVKSKAFDSLIQAAQQRIRPVSATIGGATPKADF